MFLKNSPLTLILRSLPFETATGVTSSVRRKLAGQVESGLLSVEQVSHKIALEEYI